MDNIDIKEYMSEIISTIAVVFSLGILYLGVYYIPTINYQDKVKDYNKELMRLYNTLKKENNAKEKQSKKEKEELKNVPDFLDRINNTCKYPSIMIHSLKPDMTNPFKFEISFIADYFKFLKALSEFEKLNISIDNIEIRPYKLDDNNPQNFVTLQITAINQGEKLSSEAVKFLDDEVAKKDKRNPFQRFAKIGVDIVKLIDLTYIHKLSGISRVNGENIATIDHNQYTKGDTFAGMMINHIDNSGIRLSKKDNNGITNYIIKFRKVYKKER
jgi:hypothetical protein